MGREIGEREGEGSKGMEEKGKRHSIFENKLPSLHTTAI